MTTPDQIALAAEVLSGVARRTPVEASPRLSQRYGAQILLKREDLQLGRSYKVRGAYNLMSMLSPDELARGVVCASAGNHAQGVALGCAWLGAAGHIFLPTNTPRQKRDRIAELGGSHVTVSLVGRTYDAASAAAKAYAAQTQATYVHPFDDPRTITGQGSVAVELTEQCLPDVVIVPVGGGGLLAGCATWLRSRLPGVRLIGVEPAGAPSMSAALAAGGPVDVPITDTFVDGATVGRAGDLTYPIVRDLVDEVVTVEEGGLCTEMLELYQADGVIAEPAGALATAALRTLDLGGAPVVACLVSGGNNDVSRYAEIIERSLVHEGLRHYFIVSFPQEPGALRRFLDQVLGEGEDIVVFEYIKKSNREVGPALIGIDLDDASLLEPLLKRMEASHLAIEPISPGSPLFAFLR